MIQHASRFPQIYNALCQHCSYITYVRFPANVVLTAISISYTITVIIIICTIRFCILHLSA